MLAQSHYHIRMFSGNRGRAWSARNGLSFTRMQPIARRFLSVLAGLLIPAVLFVAWHGSPVIGAGPPDARMDLSSAPAALVMISDPGCPYCARWEREVGPAYMASDDGKLAPLVRRDRRDADIRFIERVVFSPTFV